MRTRIAQRLDAVATFIADPVSRQQVRTELKAAPDLARSLARLVVGRGGPRDLAAIRDGLGAAARLAQGLDALASDADGEIAAAQVALRAPDPSLAAELARALADELPLIKRDGGFVRAGYDAALDEVRRLRDESRRVVAALQARYAEETGVRALKIRHNNVLGYFIEVTAQHGDKLMAPPANARFIHRQTLAGQVRFTTTELADLASKIASAADRALGLELDIFERLAARVSDAAGPIKQAAEALSVLDVAAGLAELAVERDYVRPEIVPTLEFTVAGGRHPVVEQALARESGPFVANDCDLSPPDGAAGRIWLVTGPNMAGKSTFLRQNALIAILAQMGSFVPARRARIGIVDRLFSRVGAADDLARGRSTFMVEMVETAAILNQAGPRSLVILDEIGRGTATFDGLSIAWATIEHLHDVNRCRALFATHFHELTALAGKLGRVLQCHHAGEGMARRGRVPARGDAGRRRPLLRHPGGEARRASRRRDRAGEARARRARGRGSRVAGATADRRSAAVRRGGAPRCVRAATGRRARRARRCAYRAQSRRDVAARSAGGLVRFETARGRQGPLEFVIAGRAAASGEG